MIRHAQSGNYVAEHQRDIAAHFDDLAEREEIKAITAKLQRERRTASAIARTWREAAQIVRSTVMPPRDPDFGWSAGDDMVVISASDPRLSRTVAAETKNG